MSKISKKEIWIIVALVGGYLLCQAIADIGATKLVSFMGYTLPAGSFIFAVTFTLRDMVHKRLGREWARAAIIMAGVFNLLMSGYLALMGRLASPPFFALADSWNAIFAIVPAIVIGSIIAEVVSELIDTEVYHYYTKHFPKGAQWLRVVISNGVSIPVDSLIFASFGFVLLPPIFGGEALPFMVALSLTAGQIIWKAVVTVVSIPGIYLIKEKKV